MQKSRHAVKTMDIPFWHTKSENGVVLPAFLDREAIAEIQAREIRPDDIFISS